MSDFSIRIDEVADLLRLERSPGGCLGASSFNVKCPFASDCHGCNDPSKGYPININIPKSSYHCVKCTDEYATGVLDLYSRVRLGERTEKGKNAGRVYRMLMSELNGSYIPGSTAAKPAQTRPKVENSEIVPADDLTLDRVYSALLKLPYLALTDEHRKSLLERGLTEEDIERGGYASMPAATSVLHDPDNARICEPSLKWRQAIEQINFKPEGVLKRYSMDELQFSVMIAGDLLFQGLPLEQIPGFHRVAVCWAFRSVEPGILIPTRNWEGLIVGLQTRRDVKTQDGLRYMTVSSKGLDRGVTTRIARTHFCMTNDEINESTNVIVTEGPLKADVALSLYRQLGKKNLAVIALQGVNSNRELPQIASWLKGKGVTRVYEAFDCDKCLNIAVMKAENTLIKIFRKKGIQVTTLYWDRSYAQKKYDQMVSLCEEHSLKWEKTESIYSDLMAMSYVLANADIDYCYIDENGTRRKERWDHLTKGIDDKLLYILKTREM